VALPEGESRDLHWRNEGVVQQGNNIFKHVLEENLLNGQIPEKRARKRGGFEKHTLARSSLTKIV
jgi:hypothetical protein